MLCSSASPIGSEASAALDRMVDRRVCREPLAYIRGSQEFYGHSFRVDSSVLVPRPETELLVEFALRACEHLSNPVVGDACTGSGCVGVSILIGHQGARLIATDLSAAALTVASRNAVALEVQDRMLAVHGDGVHMLRPGSADAVVSNPPYIPSDDIESLMPEVRDFEPRIALDGGPAGLDVHDTLAREARVVLKPGGRYGVEVGAGQAKAVANLLLGLGYLEIEVTPDLAGVQRMVTGKWQG